MVGAGGDLTSVTVPALAAIAGSVGAEPMSVAALRALHQRAIEPGETRIALACPVDADSTICAIVGASTKGAILANKARLAKAS